MALDRAASSALRFAGFGGDDFSAARWRAYATAASTAVSNMQPSFVPPESALNLPWTWLGRTPV